MLSLVKTRLPAMLNQVLLHPKSVVVVGASNNRSKPGGNLLNNILQHGFQGDLYVVNPKEEYVQGIRSFSSILDLPPVDLAILAIPANFCIDAVQAMAAEKNTQAFIVISAGFAETDDEGKALEAKLVEIVNKYGASLIGPNCIGVITQTLAGVFTSPVPALDQKGIDFVSGSGATAVFTIEAGMSKGLRFASIFSVGNSAQIGVEEILEFWDESFVGGHSPRVKLLYLESIRDPQKLLLHARSLIQKGCRIAAVKAGMGEAGSRAAQSHTGALISSELAVDALFQKAGIVRCHSREELTTVAGVLLLPQLYGTNLAVITHAGGPAVMLTDALEKGGFAVPRLNDQKVKKMLKAQLFPGSSVENPIDFLATGTAAQLGAIIDICEHDIPNVDAMIVIFGSPGLISVKEVYRLLAEKMHSCRKPIFPVLPSVVNAREAIDEFIATGHVCFPGEVDLAEAMIKVQNSSIHLLDEEKQLNMSTPEIRQIITNADGGFLAPQIVQTILAKAAIPQVKQAVVRTEEEALCAADEFGFPIAMKVVGHLHKTDVDGVLLDIDTNDAVGASFRKLMQIPGTKAVLVEQMAKGMELFIGAKRENGFDPVILFGMGGIWLEVMKDVQYGMAPLTLVEVAYLLTRLKSYPLLTGYRGQAGISISKFAQLIVRVSRLMQIAPEIRELDVNPILAEGENFQAVDVRIRIGK